MTRTLINGNVSNKVFDGEEIVGAEEENEKDRSKFYIFYSLSKYYYNR